jgi:DNA-binding CsgD family transcriptional regulator
MKAIRGIEFFTFESEAWYRLTDGAQRMLTQGDAVVREMYGFISDRYPKALAALKEWHSKYRRNEPYQRYRMVRTFCKCNFGSIDHVPDVDTDGRMHFEHVPCPLRGDCPMENVICHPEFDSKISPSEMRVLELVYRQVGVEEIADRLCLSIHTVKNHKRNAYHRIGVPDTPAFIAYANDHNLFNVE